MRTMFSPTIPQDSPDYLGRLVISYSRVYTVVRIRQNSCRPELFIATPEGEGGRLNGHWGPGGIIAEPYRTIIHWHPSLEFREDPASCETLYQSALQANEVRAPGQTRADQERRERERLCESFWREHTPAWARGYIVAELCEDESDIMTDYFAIACPSASCWASASPTAATFARCASWQSLSAPREHWPRKGRRIARTIRAAPATT